ncbi:RagB/SusD family nutrient uptake outer membrane protein [Ferruginibacter albus]|uniref:RagB/SusD family nutrient uptake outer membrane protein n=1 Tax=Ferruginibacter albus TaxID=2875540 RepID=UPI001CC4BB5C|nr:RagB/SusD family nutrient uptake outer membrane protein [Ferruginibacter albus]UAY53624.1 RagB/SusD family nutrient uptake outer membrane protein [Ferruginibacter albus]
MKYLFYLSAAIIILTSCTKILDKTPLNTINDEVVWNDTTLINAFLAEQYALSSVFVNGCSEYIQSGTTSSPIRGSIAWNPSHIDYLYNSEQGAGFTIVNDLSDESKPVWNICGIADKVKANGITPEGGVLEWWDNGYYIIRNLNQFIQRVPASPMEAAIAKTRIAEARFLRAFQYFEMVKRYGGVPLIIAVQNLTDPTDLLYPKRNTEQEVYDFIISELETIKNDLPVTNYSRASKTAALALESRAALYAGSIAKYGTIQLDGLIGISSTAANRYFEIAYATADSIIQSHTNSLYNANSNKAMNFRELFLVKHNPEMIFVKEHNFTSALSGGGAAWSYDFVQRPKPHAWDLGMAEGAYLEMAEAFQLINGSPGKLDRNAIQQGLWAMDDLWKDKDPRFFATLYTQGTLWQGGKIDFHKGLLTPTNTLFENKADAYNGVAAWGNQNISGDFGTGFGVLKYLDESNAIGTTWSNSGSDYIIFRYAEVLLNFAEAAMELGKSSDALDAINQVRNRAGITPLTAVTMNNVRQERRVELAFEGHRYWDVRRWRIAEEVLSGSNSGLRYILDYATGKYQIRVLTDIDGTNNKPNFTSAEYYFPITLKRIAANPNLLENIGY